MRSRHAASDHALHRPMGRPAAAGAGRRPAGGERVMAIRKLRYAMVGGGRDAFIGAVHRHAMALDGQVRTRRRRPLLHAREGARLGARPAASPTTQPRHVAGAARRRAAAPADERIDVVVDRDAEPRALRGRAGLRRRRLPRRLRQAAGAHERAGRRARRARGARAARVFGVTYNYTGYPMVAPGARDGARGGESARSAR